MFDIRKERCVSPTEQLLYNVMILLQRATAPVPKVRGTPPTKAPATQRKREPKTTK